MTTVQEPTRELRRLAARIDYGLGQYLAARGSSALNTEWEAPQHGWALSNISLRHAEATLTLAKSDMVLAPPAWVTARAAVEAAARCLWLLNPEDAWHREARWLALLDEGARLSTREELSGVPHVVNRAKKVGEFSGTVVAKLPEGVSIPTRVTMKNMLTEVGKDLAAFYTIASQYTHATELATRFSRTNLGTEAVYGEFIGAADWCEPMLMSYRSFRATARRLIGLSGGDIPETLFLADQQVDEAYKDFVAAAFPSSNNA